ncbi:hypothetical protein BH09CHL1_BH09CHL1_09620 [soil metagenome]
MNDLIESELLQDATIRNFEVIGEALHQLMETYPEFYNQHPEIPFQNAYSMRNKLAHLYWKTEGEIIWETIQIDLPDLREKVQSAHQNL